MGDIKYQSCIDTCVRCAQECEHCAEACLGEKNVEKMAGCIRSDRDCAEMCWTTAALLSRDSDFAAQICQLCAEVCDACGGQCESHEADHCQVCAKACRECAEECRQMAGVAS